MFHDIPESVMEQMRTLEEIDARDREDGTPVHQRLRQIPKETGRFLALMAASAPPGLFLEIGTSAGYSSLWIALALRRRGLKLTSYEILEEKTLLARDSLEKAGLTEVVEIVQGDARKHLKQRKGVAFCFLDAEKDVYAQCYESLVPNLAPGGLIIADNVTSHKELLKGFTDRAMSDVRVDSMIVRIGKGLLLCRRPED
ncbi:MAG: methyltransferase [Deltaproteobacteria bacterium CG2_30_63_29]|nr:MAG: methyltransferase [Deltaproteobacteria bacterium CG2_30_63_29]PJB33962.1 MAG: methyltransferase [Deltaproteobacteria bacterium CG_4_9_14_3_um_filter_63_12]